MCIGVVVAVSLACGDGELDTSTAGSDALDVDASGPPPDAAPLIDSATDSALVDDARPDLPAIPDAARPPPDGRPPQPDADRRPPDAAPPPPDAAPPPGEPPPLDLGAVTWLHTNVSGWRVTARLESVTFRGGQICLNHDRADAWPNGDINGVVVAANPWVFIYQGNRWWGATWEWMRPGQTCKNQSSVAGDHIKRAPFDAASGWRPRSGQVLYFMVSGLARDGMRNAEERSNLVRVVWP